MMRPDLRVTAALVLLACGNDGVPAVDELGDPWMTETDFEIGARSGGDPNAHFAPISDVRILSDGKGTLVAEAVTSRATIWTRDGSLIKEVGGYGEGPGQFNGMFFIQVHSNGFHARDGRRFTTFSTDGGFVKTVRFPPLSMSFRGFGLTPEALLSDGSILAIPAVPAEIMVGAMGDDLIHSLPILRLSEGADGWTMETVAALNNRNQYLIIGESSLPVGIPMQQFFGDYDLTCFDPVTASVVVVGRAGGDGIVELAEINADGDTVWQRRLRLPTVKPGAERAAELSDALVDIALSRSSETPDPNFRRRVRDETEDAL